VRRNGTFDVLYDDKIKEVGVKKHNLVVDVPAAAVILKPLQPPKKFSKAEAARKKSSHHWGKLRIATKMVGSLARARIRATEEKVALIGDVVKEMNQQIKTAGKDMDKRKKNQTRQIMEEMKDMLIQEERILAKEKGFRTSPAAVRERIKVRIRVM
jgi:uncharacterized coiled-coil protein SlyX